MTRVKTGKYDQARQTPCPVCGTGAPPPFCSVPGVPVFSNVLCSTSAEALAVPRGDIELSFCVDCGHIWNTTFDPEMLDYAPDYENALHFSPRFRSYAENLARRLVETYDVRGKGVVEIGCGDGQFLGLLCDLGGNRGYGFDPGHDPSRTDIGKRDDIEIVAEHYPREHWNRHADLVCCRHVLEHLPDPGRFLDDVRVSVGNQTDAVVYFEVPNVLYTLEDLGIWDILYEHCSYFSETSLRHLFERSGFAVLKTSVEYEKQFVGIDAGPVASKSEESEIDKSAISALSSLVERFAEAYQRKVHEWHHQLETMREEGRRAAVWGAGTKGNIFLNTVRVPGAIEFVVDINPRKEGRYVSGTGQKIVSPEFLKDFRPDALVIMNPAYLEEIRQSVRELGIGPEVLTA